MRRLRIVWALAIVCFFGQESFAITEYDADSIVNVMKRVAKYRMTYADIANLFNHTSANKGDKPNTYATANEGCDWDVGSFFTGLMALYNTTQDTAYLNFAKRWATTFNWQPCFMNVNATVADNWCCTQTYSDIYMLNPVAANAVMINSTKQCLTNYFDNVKPNPPYSRTNGWWWCDALYMAPPAVAKYCKASGEARFLDSLDRYWWSVSGYLYNTTYHFFYRDDGTLGSKTFWSGGNAWVIGGLAHVLDAMPSNYKDRAKFETQFKDMCSAIRAQQGFTTPFSGMWTTSMLDHTSFPGAESIGSAFFCYAFAWGVRNGLLDSATYVPSLTIAWRDLVKNIGTDGRLLNCQHVDWGPTNMLTNGDANNSAPEGEGAFMLAGSEMYIRSPQMATRVKEDIAVADLQPDAMSIQGTTVTVAIENPSSASLRMYEVDGRLACDCSSLVQKMPPGRNSLSLRSLGLHRGAFAVVLRTNDTEVFKTVAIFH
jgi:unsaturated rhamnogalacturonyl hydrolase